MTEYEIRYFCHILFDRFYREWKKNKNLDKGLPNKNIVGNVGQSQKIIFWAYFRGQGVNVKISSPLFLWYDIWSNFYKKKKGGQRKISSKGGARPKSRDLLKRVVGHRTRTMTLIRGHTLLLGLNFLPSEIAKFCAAILMIFNNCQWSLMIFDNYYQEILQHLKILTILWFLTIFKNINCVLSQQEEWG